MVLFYSTDKTPCTERLWQTVAATTAPGAGTKRYRTLRGFTQALRRPGSRAAVAVLAVASRRELDRLVAVRELLWDLRIILVLPDDNPVSAAQGHLLRPRFAAYRDGSPKEIAAVLGRLAGLVNAGGTPGHIEKRGARG